MFQECRSQIHVLGSAARLRFRFIHAKGLSATLDYNKVNGCRVKYSVQLKGLERTFEIVAPCFQGDSLRIVKRGEEWFLESSELNKCTDGNQAFAVADELLRLIHRTGYLFARLSPPFEMGYIQPYNDTGEPLRRALRASRTINVLSPDDINELSLLQGASTPGSLTVSRALQDRNIQEAFSLLGSDRDIGWHQIYDIVEFLGPQTIEKKKWATMKDVRVLRQTANHHRHLGRPKKYSLPLNPPTLGQSQTLALNLLKLWLLERLHRGAVI
jgi:hypothetical protein